MSNQPTILVKKADGTSVRMTLDEVKKMPANKKAAVKESKNALIEPETVAQKAREMLVTPELEPAPVEYLLSEPHLLHEEIEPHEISRPELVGAVSYNETVAQVLKIARLNPVPEMQSRYQSLVTSLYKGVRTLDQVMDYAQMSPDKGGLGLNQIKANNFLAALTKIPGLPAVQSIRRPVAVVSNPIKSGFSNSSSAVNNRPMSVIAQNPMHDVVVPPRVPTIMGPVEEIQHFTLLDWRRLAATPDKAKEILLAKFTGWKEESFFLYRDARAAWFKCPLIMDYQTQITGAINNNIRLSEMVGSRLAKNTLSVIDISALVEVNRQLAV